MERQLRVCQARRAGVDALAQPRSRVFIAVLPVRGVVQVVIRIMSCQAMEILVRVMALNGMVTTIDMNEITRPHRSYKNIALYAWPCGE